MNVYAADDWPERDQALQLIGEIYDAALEPGRWQRLVGEIVRFVGGTKGLIFTPFATPKDGGFVFLHGLSAPFLQQWQDKYLEHDLWAVRAREKRIFVTGAAMLGTDIVPEAEFCGSLIYQEFARHNGIGQLCTGVVFGPGFPDIPATVCSVFRALSEERFGDGERERMSVLVPHLSRALGVMFRLRCADLKSAASLSSLDHLTSAILLFHAHGEIAFANRAARELLRENDGLRMRELHLGGALRLLARDSRDQTEIDSAINECLSPASLSAPHFSRTLRLSRPSRRESYVFQVAPLTGNNEFCRGPTAARAIGFLVDPDCNPALDHALLRRTYHLSPSEAKLADLLCSGETLADAAKRMGIAHNTSRVHLKSIFRKTGVSRQAELLKLLLAFSSIRL